MAWNPSKEVAVARDAAKSLNATSCVVLWVSADGEHFGMASTRITEEQRAKAISGLQAMTAKIEAKEKKSRREYRRNLREAAAFGMGGKE